MNEEKSRIEFLKEKMDQNKIALELFGGKEGSFSFLDSNSSKSKLNKVYKIAYDNIIEQARSDKNDSYNNTLSLLKLELSKLHIEKNKNLSFFVFGKKAYEITLPVFLLLKNQKAILNNLRNEEILIYSPSLRFGACVLVDEHFISFSSWDL